MFSKHSKPHGDAVPPLQRQEDPAAKQPVTEGHGFVLGQESRVQVLEGGETRRRDVQIQRVQPGLPENRSGLVQLGFGLCSLRSVYHRALSRPGQQSEQTPGQFLNRSLQEQVTGTQEHAGQAGEFGDREDHLKQDKTFLMTRGGQQ